uniref:Uncharacterized protein n=1 Tax=uncultured prokaryote TaxID=198431 RepID=A0A0H5Q5S3_9ZZZZ|nr:hypothetical protein [uncultured prokaryote]
MPVDSFFSSSTVVPIERKASLRPRSVMSEVERLRVLRFVTDLPAAVGGWQVSFDATYGSGDWPGRRPGSRRDQRDMLVCNRRRGFDPDDAVASFSRFMDRTAHGVTWFASAEPNPDFSGLNPGYHIHAVLAGAENDRRRSLSKLWTEENGYCKIGPIRSSSACVTYCTKHLVRRGSIYAWKINNSLLWHSHVKAQATDEFPLETPALSSRSESPS